MTASILLALLAGILAQFAGEYQHIARPVPQTPSEHSSRTIPALATLLNKVGVLIYINLLK